MSRLQQFCIILCSALLYVHAEKTMIAKTSQFRFYLRGGGATTSQASEHVEGANSSPSLRRDSLDPPQHSGSSARRDSVDPQQSVDVLASEASLDLPQHVKSFAPEVSLDPQQIIEVSPDSKLWRFCMEDSDENAALSIATLLGMGAIVNSRPDKQNVSPYASLLHCAAARGLARTTRELLRLGANVSAVDGNMQTPLHLSARAGHIDASLALLEAGSNSDACDIHGRDVLAMAREGGHRNFGLSLLSRSTTMLVVGVENAPPLPNMSDIRGTETESCPDAYEYKRQQDEEFQLFPRKKRRVTSIPVNFTKYLEDSSEAQREAELGLAGNEEIGLDSDGGYNITSGSWDQEDLGKGEDDDEKGSNQTYSQQDDAERVASLSSSASILHSNSSSLHVQSDKVSSNKQSEDDNDVLLGKVLDADAAGGEEAADEAWFKHLTRHEDDGDVCLRHGTKDSSDISDLQSSGISSPESSSTSTDTKSS